MLRNEMILIYIEGHQYFYVPVLAPCICGRIDFQIDDASASSIWIECNICNRHVVCGQDYENKCWLKIENAWNEGKSGSIDL